MKKSILIFALILSVLLTLGSCVASDGALTPSAEPSAETSSSPVPEVTPNPEVTPTPETSPTPALSYIPTASDLRDASEMEPLGVQSGAALVPSKELPEGAISVDFKGMPAVPTATRQDDITVYKDVVYRTVDDRDLIVHILVPDGITDGPYPLVIYIQGSAFMGNARSMISMGINQMMTVAEEGYAVAIVEHRGTMPTNGGARFPDQVYDVKTAVRFLRKNAEEYNFDSDKFVIWGNSSGAYHAVFAGVTGDESFTEGDYGDYSSEVSLIIDEYGPSQLLYMSYAPSMMDHAGPMSPEGAFAGGINLLNNHDKAEEASSTTYISEKEIPPTLIMHGSADYVVPFNQSVRLYEKLREYGHDVTFYKLEGDGHGMGGFNTIALREIILEFIKENI